MPHEPNTLGTTARRHRVGGICLLILGAIACVWLYPRSRDVSPSARRTDAYEREHEPAAAVRMNALQLPFVLSNEATPKASGHDSVERLESGMVVVTRTYISSGQAGAPATVAIATSSEPSPSELPPTAPSASESPPSHAELEAQWAAEPPDEHTSGDGTESAAIAQLGLNAKMVLSAECRTSVCRVEVVIPWAEPNPDTQPVGDMRAPDNPDPDRDITALFYPRGAPSTASAAEQHVERPE